MGPTTTFVLLLFMILSPLVLFRPQPTSALPLSTSGRWIVDDAVAGGRKQRVKLACVNWPSHLEPMVAEGLNKRPLNEISKSITSMGFNCVRFTWALRLVTDESLANVTVRQSFQQLGLDAAINGLETNNPILLDQTLIQAFKAVVLNMGSNNVMVILDNHITIPGWCCQEDDDNGFFGDRYFDPDEWINGLTRMATMFSGISNVVGMSLRNELRGRWEHVPNWFKFVYKYLFPGIRREHVHDWFKYMQLGAEAVHKVNPNVLVILSGLNFDTDLSFLASQNLELSFSNKLVYEVHWYAFTNTRVWTTNNPNDACGHLTTDIMKNAGFLVDRGIPLFMSEWGIDQREVNENDNKFLGCLMAFAAERDLDWSLWGLQGSYYLREGAVDTEETYGTLSMDWSKPRNPEFLKRISALQPPFQGPGLNSPSHTILFHPSTGMCVAQDNPNSPLQLGPCSTKPIGWTYTPSQNLQIFNTNLYLKASTFGQPPMLGNVRNDFSMRWDMVSGSGMQVMSKLADNLCLDVGPDGHSLVTNTCKCADSDTSCDPEGQWFKMVNSTRPLL